MTHYQIKNRWTGAVLFEGDFDTMRLCVEAANLSDADLSGADLSRANLFGANLSGANLSGANLSRANLSRANLFGANLSRANLFGANLSRANLFGANLSGANLSGANLSGVKITALRKTCSRSDGYEFLLFQGEDHTWRVMAGCRWFSVEDAWTHWLRTRDGTPLGEETFDILVMFEHHIERVEART
jgi:hypothetical protein